MSDIKYCLSCHVREQKHNDGYCEFCHAMNVAETPEQAEAAIKAEMDNRMWMIFEDVTERKFL